MVQANLVEHRKQGTEDDNKECKPQVILPFFWGLPENFK
jgi:hypothetical protein